MSNISYIRKGIIKNIEGSSISIEMDDTNKICIWPLQENQEDSDIIDTLQIGEDVTIILKISDNPFQSPKNEKTKEAKMRKLLENLVN